MEDRDPTVRARHIGRTLTRAMREKGFNIQEEIAAELGWSQTKVSRLLSGKQKVSSVDLAAFLALCGIIGPPRDRLLTLAEEMSDESPWCEDYGMCLPAELPALCELENTAISLTCVDMMAVPALGQTEVYRRVLLRATPVIPDAEVAERVTLHRVRQRHVLNRSNPPTLRVFLTEQVLADPGVDRSVRCDQAHDLLRLAVRPHIEIRVIPARCLSPAGYPSFQFMTFRDARSVVYLEQLTSTTFLDYPTTVASYETVLAEIDSIALDVQLSRTKLAKIAAVLSEPPGPSGAPEQGGDGLGQLPR